MSATAAALVLDPTLTVNAVLARWPSTVAPLNALGIDCCCGGGASLRAAAAEAGVPLDVLLAALRASILEPVA